MEEELQRISKLREAAANNEEYEKAAEYRDKEKELRAKYQKSWNVGEMKGGTKVPTVYADDVAAVLLNGWYTSTTFNGEEAQIT